MTYTIPASCMIDNKSGVMVEAQSTVSEHFIVQRGWTAEYGNGTLQQLTSWRGKSHKLTHAPTGRVIARNVGVKQAKALAGAISGLPIDWSATDHQAIFSQARELPANLRNWLITL